MSDDGKKDPETIDLRASAEEVARHLRLCASCRSALERARAIGPDAMAAWRRQLAECFRRAPG